MKKIFRINMNDRVKVKLTKEGKDVLRELYLELPEIENEYWVAPLWQLMIDFGPSIERHICSFEKNNLLIESEQEGGKDE